MTTCSCILSSSEQRVVNYKKSNADRDTSSDSDNDDNSDVENLLDVINDFTKGISVILLHASFDVSLWCAIFYSRATTFISGI